MEPSEASSAPGPESAAVPAPDAGAGVGLGAEVASLEDQTLWPPYCNPLYVMPNEIEVKVSMQTGEYYFAVGITKFHGKKPYLGGYRNTVNGLSYHHGSSQTPTENKFRVKDTSDLRSRETQTFEQRTLSVQPVRECGTQMTRQDLSVDTKRDVTLKPRAYFTAEMLNELKKDKCIILQRTWRGHMARCQAAVLRRRNIQHEQQLQADLRSTAALDKEERAHDMLRRLHPVSNKDFEKLYNELDVWRRAEAAKIKVSMAVSLSLYQVSAGVRLCSFDCPPACLLPYLPT